MSLPVCVWLMSELCLLASLQLKIIARGISTIGTLLPVKEQIPMGRVTQIISKLPACRTIWCVHATASH
jgi:hypothetical protein